MLDRPLSEIPVRALQRPAPRIESRRAEDGVVYLRCGLPYEPGPMLIDYLYQAAELRPEATFLAERGPVERGVAESGVDERGSAAPWRRGQP